MNNADKFNLFAILLLSCLACRWEINMFFDIAIGFGLWTTLWYLLMNYREFKTLMNKYKEWESEDE